MSGTDGR
jgi:hypothetical protein